MTVRAKFRVNSYTTRKNGEEEIRDYQFSAVYGGDDPGSENAQFWKWTPSGVITLSSINRKAWEYFDLNQTYYIDFIKTEDKANANKI